MNKIIYLVIFLAAVSIVSASYSTNIGSQNPEEPPQMLLFPLGEIWSECNDMSPAPGRFLAYGISELLDRLRKQCNNNMIIKGGVNIDGKNFGGITVDCEKAPPEDSTCARVREYCCYYNHLAALVSSGNFPMPFSPQGTTIRPPQFQAPWSQEEAQFETELDPYYTTPHHPYFTGGYATISYLMGGPR